MTALPAVCDDSVRPLGGVVHAELSWLFLGYWSADIACPCDRLFFSRRCAVGAIGETGIVESPHNRIESIFWQFSWTDGFCEDAHAPRSFLCGCKIFGGNRKTRSSSCRFWRAGGSSRSAAILLRTRRVSRCFRRRRIINPEFAWCTRLTRLLFDVN
jgi:hypothetical protein